MNRSRKALRRLVAKIGIVAMLFAQLAVAAYACAAPAGSANSMRAVMADEMSVAMPDCDQLDAANPNLCLQYCQAGNQSVQTSPQVSVPVIAVFFLAIVEPVQPAFTPGRIASSIFMARVTSPPPWVLFGVLRI
jgi:hypothetical protein